jgi:hypothetical protein
LRLVTLATPLIAAWRKGSARASAASPPRRSILAAGCACPHGHRQGRLEPAPSDYLDPAAEVKMLKGGTRRQQAWQMTVAAINAWLDDFAPAWARRSPTTPSFPLRPCW